MVGKTWVKYQKKTGTYSGLRIHLLSENCGLKGYYAEVYGLQCLKSHSVDPLAYLGANTVAGKSTVYAKLLSDDRELRQLQITLTIACEVFHYLLNDLDRAFNLGIGEKLTVVVRQCRAVNNNADATEGN